MADPFVGEPLQRPVPHALSEQVDELLGRNALLVHVLRRVAEALHRTHNLRTRRPGHSAPTWVNCADSMCYKIHEAIAGRLVLDSPGPNGVANATVPLIPLLRLPDDPDPGYQSFAAAQQAKDVRPVRPRQFKMSDAARAKMSAARIAWWVRQKQTDQDGTSLA